MTIKGTLKRLAERVTGIHFLRSLPRGVDIFHDIKSYLPNLQVKVVFDVGANLGQSAQSYLRGFPGSRIYCFEPVDATFHQLQENLHKYGNVLSFKLALAAKKGTGKMVLEGKSDMFFLLNTALDVEIGDELRLEAVDLETIDGFCEQRNITGINFLKIDTEGGDFDVLTGAENMLTGQNVDVIEVEAGMNRTNKRHVPFEKLKGYFEDRRYFLFGVYDQVREWPRKEPSLRRTNLIFISERVVKANVAT